MPVQAATLADANKRCTERDTADGRRINQYVWIVDCWRVESGAHIHNLSDIYTKWMVTLDEGQSDSFYRNYVDEERMAIERLFQGKTKSTIIALKLATVNPAIDLTQPLVTFSYEGRVGAGETFVTSLTASSADQPYFRLTAATATNVNLSAKVTKASESRFAVAILGYVQNALKIAAPPATLLTKINSEGASKVASALDTTLSGLAAESKSESMTVGQLIEHWNRDSKLLARVYIPREMAPSAQGAEAPTKRSRVDPVTRERLPKDPSSWLTFRIELTCPRYSMFSDLDVCDIEKSDGELTDATIKKGMLDVVTDLRERLRPQQVVDFQLAAGVTVRQHLAGKDWFQRFLRIVPGKAADIKIEKGVQVAGEKVDDLEMTSFCESILNELYAIGLSSLDARIGLWATISATGDLGQVRRLMGGNTSCKAGLPGEDWFLVPDQQVKSQNAPAP